MGRRDGFSQHPLGDPEEARALGLRHAMAGEEWQGGDVHQFVRSYYERGYAVGRCRRASAQWRAS